jgi:hypothetical protein
VKWIIACWIVSIQGNTFEAVDGIGCGTRVEVNFSPLLTKILTRHYFINIKKLLNYLLLLATYPANMSITTWKAKGLFIKKIKNE